MPKRVLIIDDEMDMQIYLRTLLKKAGYEVRVAVDGEQGVAEAKSWRPDLITMDILMPKQSGVVAYDALGEAPETASIPVVVVSGMPERTQFFSEHPGRRSAAGIFDKPIDRETFLAKVKGLLGE